MEICVYIRDTVVLLALSRINIVKSCIQVSNLRCQKVTVVYEIPYLKVEVEDQLLLLVHDFRKKVYRLMWSYNRGGDLSHTKLCFIVMRFNIFSIIFHLLALQDRDHDYSIFAISSKTINGYFHSRM